MLFDDENVLVNERERRITDILLSLDNEYQGREVDEGAWVKRFTDGLHMQPLEIQVSGETTREGMTYSFSVPFRGDQVILQHLPSNENRGIEDATIEDGRVVFKRVASDFYSVKSWKDRRRTRLEVLVAEANADVEAYNASVPDLARRLVARERRDRLQKPRPRWP